MKNSSQKIFILSLIQLLGIQADAQIQSGEVNESLNSISAKDDCEVCVFDKALDQPTRLVSRASLYVSTTQNYETSKANISKIISLLNPESKKQVIDLVNLFVYQYFSDLSGSYSPEASVVVAQLEEFLYSSSFDPNLSTTSGQLQDYISKLETITKTKVNKSLNINLTVTGNQQKDELNVLYAIQSVNQNNLSKVADFVTEFLGKYYGGIAKKNPAIYTSLNEASSLLRNPAININDPSICARYKALINDLNRIASSTSENSSGYFQPGITGNKEIDEKNLVNGLNLLSNQYFGDYYGALENYFKRYYYTSNGYDPADNEIINQIKGLIKKMLENPQNKPTPNQLEDLLHRLDSEHQNSSATPYITLELTNNRKSDLRAVISLVKEASKASSPQVAELVIAFINKHYANNYGTFDQSIQDIVDQITPLVKSTTFDASDHVSKSLITKQLEDLEMAYFRAKYPKEAAGNYNSFEITGNIDNDSKKLLESLKSINPYNKQDAIDSIMNFIQHYYSLEGGYSGNMVSITYSIISMIQSSKFEPSNPSNQEKMKGWFLQLENARKEAENQPNKFIPYQVPSISDDRISSQSNIIKSISTVNSRNQMDFVAFIIKYLKEQYSGDKMPFDLRAHNTIMQFIDYTKSEYFDPSNEITINQIQYFFDQLNQIYDELKDPNAKTKGFPELKWTSNKEEDIKMLLDAIKSINNSNRQYASNIAFSFMETYYSREDRTFDPQLQGSIVNILNMIKNPEFKGNEHSIDKIRYEFDQLEYKFSLIEYESKYNKFTRPTLSGDKSRDQQEIFDSIKLMKSGDKQQVIDVIWEFILLNYGYAGGQLDESLTSIASEIIKTIQASNFKSSNVGKLEELIKKMDEKKKAIEEMDSTSTPYTPPEATNDKFEYIEKLLNSITGINNKNRMDVYKTFNKCFIKFYGNPDGTIPHQLQGPVNEILAMIKSPDVNPNEPKNLEKIKQNFDLLNKALKSSKGGQNPSVYVEPVFTKDKEKDTEKLIDSFKNVNQANIPLVTGAVIKFLDLYYLGQNGLYPEQIEQYITGLMMFIQSPNFDSDSNYKQEARDKINLIDAAFKEAQKQASSGDYEAPAISGEIDEDKENFIKSIKTITPSTVNIAISFLDKYFEKYYCNQHKYFEPIIQSKIARLKDILTSSKFKPKEKFSELNIRGAFDDIEVAYSKLNNPGSTAFSKVKLSGDIKKDLGIAIELLSSITKENQKAAEGFYSSFFKQYYGRESGGYDINIHPKVYEILSVIKSPDFKPKDSQYMEKVKQLINELDKISTGNKNAHKNPVYVPPHLTGDRKTDWQSFLYSLKELNPFTKDGAIKYAKSLLDSDYGNPDGSMNYRFASLKSEFIERLQSKDFNQADEIDINDLSQMLDEMDVIQANLIVGNEVESLKTPVFTGNKNRDFSGFLRMVQYITKAYIEDASTYLSKFIIYYYGKKDGSLDMRMFIPANNMQQYLKSNEFNPSKTSTTSRLRQLFKELEDAYKAMLQSDDISPPFSQPMLTGNPTTDRNNLIQALSSVNRGNRNDAVKFIDTYLISDFGTKKGGFDQEFISIVTEIRKLSNPSSCDLADPKIQVKLNGLFIEMEEALRMKEESKIAKHYQHPTLTNDQSSNIIKIGESFANATDSNQEEISQFIKNYVNSAFVNKDGVLDMDIRTLNSQLNSLINQKNFSFKNQEHAEQVLYQLNQINSKYQILHKAENAVPYVIPIFTENIKEDQARLFDSFKDIVQTRQNKELMKKAVIQLISVNYEKSGSSHSFMIAPKKQELINTINQEDFDFTSPRSSLKLKQLLNEISAAFKNSESIITTRSYYPPQLTNNNRTKDFELIIQSFSQVTPDNKADAIEFLYSTMNKYYGNPQGILSLQMNNVAVKMIRFLDTPGLDFKNPAEMQKIWVYLKEAEQLDTEAKNPQAPEDPFTPPSFTNDRTADFNTLVQVVKSQGKKGSIDVYSYMENFLNHHYKTSANGIYDEDIYPLYMQAVQLFNSNDFDLNNKKNLDELQNIINNLNSQIDKIRNAPPPPKPYVAPTLTNNADKDLEDLISSLKNAHQARREDIQDAFEKYFKLHYEGSKSSIPAVYSTKNNVIRFILDWKNDLQTPGSAKMLKGFFLKMKDEIQKFYKNQPPEYKAPELTENRDNDLIALMASFVKASPKYKREAEDAVSNYMNKYYGNNKLSFPPELMDEINAIFGMVTDYRFNFSDSDHTARLQSALLNLKTRSDLIKTPRPVCADFKAPSLPDDKRDIARSRLLKSLKSVSECNQHQALKFVDFYMKKYYYEDDQSVSQNVDKIINDIWSHISSNKFDFSNEESLEYIEEELIKLEKVYEDSKSSQKTPYKTFKLTGKLFDDQQHLIWSLNSVNSYNKHQATKQILEFLNTYYRDSNQKFEKPIYDYATKLMAMVEAPGFNFANMDTQKEVVNILSQMDMLLKQIQAPGEGNYGFVAPILTGKPIKDQTNFLEVVSTLTKEQKPAIISYLMSLLNYHYKSRDGKVKGKLYDLSNVLWNLISAPDFDPQNEESVDKIRKIFREMDQEQEKLLASTSESTYPKPVITKNYDYDITQLFASFKFANNNNKNDVILFIGQFMNSEFAKPNSQLDYPLNDIASQINTYISSNSFNFSNENDLKLLKSLLDKMNFELKRKISEESGTGYNLTLITGNRSDDLQNLIYSFDSITPMNKLDAIASISNFIRTYYAIPGSKTFSQLNDIIGKFFETINSDKFQFDTQGKQQLIDIITQIDLKWCTLNKQAENYKPFPVLHFTNNIDSDEKYLMSALSTITPSTRLDGIKAIMSFVSNYYGDGKEGYDKIYYPIVDQLNQMIQSQEFDMASQNGQDKINEIFKQLAVLKKQYNDEINARKPFEAPELTGNLETDKRKLFESLSKVSKYNQYGAKDALLKFIKVEYSSKYGHMDLSVQEAIQKIKIIILDSSADLTQSSTILSIKQGFDDLDKLISRLNNPVYVPFVPPPLSEELTTNDALLQSVIQQINPNNRKDVIAFVINYLSKHYSYSDGTFDSVLYPMIMKLLYLVDSDTFDPTDYQTQVDIDHIILDIQLLHDRRVIPRKYYKNRN